MKFVKDISIILCLLIAIQEISAEFPSFITKCKKTDSKCLVKNANKALAKVLPGIPEMGLFNTEKFNVDYVPIKLDENIDLSFYNGKGITYRSSISSFKIEDDVIKFNINVPVAEWYLGVTVNGTYDNKPFEHKGDADFTYMNGQFSFKGKLISQDINGKRHLQVEPIKGISKLISDDFEFNYKLSDDVPEKEKEFLNKSFAGIKPKILNAVASLGEIVISKVISLLFSLVSENDVFLP